MGKLRLRKELYPKPPTNKQECQLVSGTWGPGLRRAGPVPLAALHPARRREAPGPGSPQRQDPPRGLGTEALPNRGPSCTEDRVALSRLSAESADGARRPDGVPSEDTVGANIPRPPRTLLARTRSSGPLQTQLSLAPPPAPATCASEFPGTVWGPPSSLPPLSLPELVLPSSFSLVIKKH